MPGSLSLSLRTWNGGITNKGGYLYSNAIVLLVPLTTFTMLGLKIINVDIKICKNNLCTILYLSSIIINHFSYQLFSDEGITVVQWLA